MFDEPKPVESWLIRMEMDATKYNLKAPVNASLWVKQADGKWVYATGRGGTAALAARDLKRVVAGIEDATAAAAGQFESGIPATPYWGRMEYDADMRVGRITIPQRAAKVAKPKKRKSRLRRKVARLKRRIADLERRYYADHQRDSSVGVWPATTNLMNNLTKTNTTGWVGPS